MPMLCFETLVMQGTTKKKGVDYPVNQDFGQFCLENVTQWDPTQESVECLKGGSKQGCLLSLLQDLVTETKDF